MEYNRVGLFSYHGRRGFLTEDVGKRRLLATPNLPFRVDGKRNANLVASTSHFAGNKNEKEQCRLHCSIDARDCC